MTTNNPIPPSQSNSQPFSFNDAGVVEFYQGPVIIDESLTVKGNLTVDGTIDGGTVVYDNVTVTGQLIANNSAAYPVIVSSKGGATPTITMFDTTDGGAILYSQGSSFYIASANAEGSFVAALLSIDENTGNVALAGLLSANDVWLAGLLSANDGATVTGAGLVVGSPTSGDLGAGTINAEGIYVKGAAILPTEGAVLDSTSGGTPTFTNTSAEMFGAGTAWAITPASTGRAMIGVQGYLESSTGTNEFFAQLHYGTGTPPAKGAAVVGTAIGNIVAVSTTGVATPAGISMIGLVSGLVVGTAYWVDLAVYVNNATNTVSIETMDACIAEV